MADNEQAKSNRKKFSKEEVYMVAKATWDHGGWGITFEAMDKRYPNFVDELLAETRAGLATIGDVEDHQ